MSKSLGNLVTIKDVLKRYSADALRVFVLSSHYRSPLTYSEEALEASERGVERLRQVKTSTILSGSHSSRADEFREKFAEAMDDDFNTPRALAALFDLAKEINRAQDAGLDCGELIAAFNELGTVLGLTLSSAISLDGEMVRQVAARILHDIDSGYSIEPELSPEAIVEHLVQVRDDLRLKKLWDKADLIRTQLAKCGVVLEDTPHGTEWRLKMP